MGWENAALISLFVALLEPTNVTAVCCLGLPLKSMSGWRGDEIDPILGLQCPVFLASGSNAANSSIDEIDDLRDQLHVSSSLVVVEVRIDFKKQEIKIQIKRLIFKNFNSTKKNKFFNKKK